MQVECINQCFFCLFVFVFFEFSVDAICLADELFKLMMNC